MRALLSSLALGCTLVLHGGCHRRQPSATAAERPMTLVPLLIHNRSAEGICYVNLSRSGDATWGPDRLSHGEMIAPGTTRGWRLSPGLWDVQLWSCTQRPLLIRRGVSLAADEVTLEYP